MSRILGLENAHLRIGHNGGPPLDVGYHAWVWRRAHEKAWKTPGREIALLRMRSAERLGLDYRTYTSVLMNKGTRLEALLLMVDGQTLAFEDVVVAKLARLADCAIMLCVPERFTERGGLSSLANSVFAISDVQEPQLLGKELRERLRTAGIPAATVFMVGMTSVHHLAAERAGLGTFVSAREYFGFGAG